MLERLLPHYVACAEAREDRLDVELFPSERPPVANAVDRRRREFMTGRACARTALRRLGAPEVAVPSGSDGEPLWPAGIVGSITHCDGYRACAVARSHAALTVGIDAEPNAPLPDGVLEEVVHGRELDLVRRPPATGDGVAVPRLLFSAKEAVYKAWFPLTRRWLDFADVEVSLDPARARFRAALLVPGPVVDGVALTELSGRWAVQDGIVCTAIVVPAPRACA